jgi:hypothetical protein
MQDKYLQTESKSPMIYWLNEEDVQNVAKEELGRELTSEEIKRITQPIGENIDWSDAISIAIFSFGKLRADLINPKIVLKILTSC